MICCTSEATSSCRWRWSADHRSEPWKSRAASLGLSRRSCPPPPQRASLKAGMRVAAAASAKIRKSLEPHAGAATPRQALQRTVDRGRIVACESPAASQQLCGEVETIIEDSPAGNGAAASDNRSPDIARDLAMHEARHQTIEHQNATGGTADRRDGASAGPIEDRNVDPEKRHLAAGDDDTTLVGDRGQALQPGGSTRRSRADDNRSRQNESANRSESARKGRPPWPWPPPPPHRCRRRHWPPARPGHR